MTNTFEIEQRKHIAAAHMDLPLRNQSLDWLVAASRHKYSYNFSWLGRPIIQFPADILAVQEIIWKVKPDLIIETGVAHGGSLVFSASILELLGNDGEVIGIDIDIRSHNRAEIEKHPLSKRITMIEGSSIEEKVTRQVFALAQNRKHVMILLDSNHTHEHVLAELRTYSPLVKLGSYVVVFDTIIDDFPPGFFHDRPWGPGNSPKSAVHEFLTSNDRFEIDKDFESKLLLTVAPDGYLKCVKD